jgi:hypothetical protein
MFYDRARENYNKFVKEKERKGIHQDKALENINLAKILDDSVVILLEDNNDLLNLVQNINLESFKDIKLPFPNIFIETQIIDVISMNKIRLGIHVYHDKYIINKMNHESYFVTIYHSHHRNKLDLELALLKPESLPRFFYSCHKKDDCMKSISPTSYDNGVNLDTMLCMRTERTSSNCDSKAKFVCDCIKTIIYVANLINTQPKYIEYANIQSEIGKPENGKRNIPLAKESKYIYIRTIKPKRFKIKNPTTIEKKRQSPKPHRRRGHLRHYRSGKVIWIETTYVGLKELANKKVYKLRTT